MKNKTSRVGILDSVKDVLGFFVLVVLIVEGIFGSVLVFSGDVDKSKLLTYMLIIILALIATVAFLAVFRPEALTNEKKEIKNPLKELVGKYSSVWEQENEEIRGDATFEIQNNNIKIIVSDTGASSYEIIMHYVKEGLIIGEWKNLNYDDDYGIWNPTISANGKTLKGDFVTNGGKESGMWTMKKKP